MPKSLLVASVALLAIATSAPAARAAPQGGPPVEVCREQLLQCIATCNGNMSCHAWCEELYARCIGPDRPEAQNRARLRSLVGPRDNILNNDPGLPPRGPAGTGAPIAPTAPPVRLR